jgi:glycosyltransferase involved in cell wall biosynthesis
MSAKPSITFFGTYLSRIRGSKISSETIADALSERDYRVALVSQCSSAPLRVLDSLWCTWAGQRDLAVLDVFSSRVLNLTRLIAASLRRQGVPMIAILQGGALLENYSRIEALLTPILRGADRIISPSGFLCEGFVKKGYQVSRIPNALNLDRFPYREHQPPTDVVRLLWVRAFAEIYRPHWAVEVVDHLRQFGIGSRLTMVGPDKGLMGDVEARAMELGVADLVDLVGPVPNDQLAVYYQKHDFLLNTTKFESFGVALAESAACGLPIVSAAVGEVSHAWDDEQNIFLVPGLSSREFAERIAALHGNDLGREKYCAVSLAGREKVTEFAVGNVLPCWEKMIESVCRGRAG